MEAIRLLLANIPQVAGRFIYIVAQHMATESHMQLMSKLIGIESRWPVLIAHDDEILQTDTVYLIPAGHDGYVVGNKLHLLRLSGHFYSKPSINVLFNSIAREFGPDGVGIILSGTGTDGVAGCQAIKFAGGLTIAQDIATAQFTGMPSAAIDAGAIKHILSPVDMGALLDSRLLGKPVQQRLHSSLDLHITGGELSHLIEAVHRTTGLDFSGYKDETLVRRIRSRVLHLKINSIDHYIQHCILHPDELNNLKQMFLVTMSSFFRDKAAFTSLGAALSKLLDKKPPAETLRILVPACASGEECFSIAIMIAEILEQKSMIRSVRINGVDLNQNSIDRAKEGLYPLSSLKEMDWHLIHKYFTKEISGYRIVEKIRSMCLFTQSDVFKVDTLFKYDLVSCRNLLIYFKPELQEMLIEKFYNELSCDGLLFLGQAENVGLSGVKYFYPVDYHHRLYQRRVG